ESCYINALTERRRQTAADGTVKFLFALRDGNAVESVLMRHDYGDSLCISTQVGCKMGCKFCASTLGGKIRDLTASELLDQLYCASALTGRHIDSVVMMGIGEPLDNLQNVLRFLELVREPDGLGLSHRHISLSTCGLADRIDELAAYHLQLTLSVSLHAADDKTRSSIMPVNRKFPIETLLDACKRYFATTGRRISYEYALIAGVNDSPAHAARLAALLHDQGCHVNLILVNPVKETGFSRGSRAEAERFRESLAATGLSATIRRELGTEIDAACGQLRRSDAREESCRVDDR
ncbi:MAG: 23S rRNA (adenine(2503)-C(2))-methyltransferase RlmN, partial [Oscillospiraceae bacterium]